MRKHLLSRIIGFAVLYCSIFIALVFIQFSNKGYFSLTIGEMIVKGRYQQSVEESYETGIQALSDGVTIFFGGIEFYLNDDKNGLVLADNNGFIRHVNPEYMVQVEDSVYFGLPGGTILVFESIESARGPELRITAEFAENILYTEIFFEPRRSLIVRENEQFGISYNSMRYIFNRSSSALENGKLILSSDNAVASYRSMGRQSIFDPDDYVIASAQTEQDYNDAVFRWQSQNFQYWNQNISFLQSENEVIAYCGESLRQGNYRTAVASIPRTFLNSTIRSHYSSGFLGGMTAAFRSFNTVEREMINFATRMINERSIDLLMEDHILEYLLARSYTAIANNAMEFIRSIDPEEISLLHCPGLLEVYIDFYRWNLPGENPAGQFMEQVFLLITENINHDIFNELVFVTQNEELDLMFNLRLGKALVSWADETENPVWAAVGRSIILSVLSESEIGDADIYTMLKPGDYNPRGEWLMENGLWAWTVSQTAGASFQGSDINLAITFPEGMSHFVIIRGVRPFVKIQIHGLDYRSDSQFETYDSSGWVYYPQDQTLILKLRHRVTTEIIRIFYTADTSLPPVIPPPASDELGI
jgi:hypothetical protein